MPRPTSPREELLRTPTPPGQAAGNPRRGFPPARKGFVFVDIPRKLDVGTATIRYLVNLPHVRVRYGVQKKKKEKVYKSVRSSKRAHKKGFSSSSFIRIYGVFRQALTQWREPWAELIGSSGRFCSEEKLELGLGASKMEVEGVNKVQ